MLSRIACVTVAAGITIWAAANAQEPYAPPKESAPLLKKVDFTKAVPVNETYRNKFVKCDAQGTDKTGKDKFEGPAGTKTFDLVAPYKCSDDPSRVKAMLKLADGGIYWDSKMALDVDGSWAAWGGTKWVNSKGKQIKTTDLCGTSMKWKAVPADETDCTFPEAQVDSDRFPFAVMPTSGVPKITGKKDHKAVGAEFANVTGLKMRDMGVVIHGNRWSPVFIADGGPFMRLGEGSARVFKNLGEDRCRKWNETGMRCVGPDGKLYPYVNSGIRDGVIFILYPGSGRPDMTSDNAIATICAFAKDKLGLTGGDGCP